MSEMAESILIAALDLSLNDRGKILDALFETLPTDDPTLDTQIEQWRATLPDEEPIISMRLGGADSADEARMETEPPDSADEPLSDSARPLLAAALAGSTLDRAIIAEELLGSLGPPPGWVEVTEEEMHAELQRRIEECERDPSSCIPWEQVRDRLMDELDDVRPNTNRD